MRDKLTNEQKSQFYLHLDNSLEKLDSSKNRLKPHWRNHTIVLLSKMIDIENKELSMAVYKGEKNGIKTECYDLINLCLMILDNIENFESSEKF